MYSYLHDSIKPIVNFIYLVFTSISANTALTPNYPFYQPFLETGVHQILLSISFAIYAFLIFITIYGAFRVLKYCLRRFNL